jgi:hypothetical protein
VAEDIEALFISVDNSGDIYIGIQNDDDDDDSICSSSNGEEDIFISIDIEGDLLFRFNKIHIELKEYPCPCLTMTVKAFSV